MLSYCQCDVPLHTKMLGVDRKTPIANEQCWRCKHKRIEPAKFQSILEKWEVKIRPYIGTQCKNAECPRPFPIANVNVSDKDEVVCGSCHKELETVPLCVCGVERATETLSTGESACKTCIANFSWACVCEEPSSTQSIFVSGQKVSFRCRNTNCLRLLTDWSREAARQATEKKLLSIVLLPCTCLRAITPEETLVCERCNMLLAWQGKFD